MLYRIRKKDALIFFAVFALLGAILIFNKTFKNSDYSVVEDSSLPKVYAATSFPLALDWIKAAGQDRIKTDVFVSPSDSALDDWMKESLSNERGFSYRLFFSMGNGFDDWTADIGQRSDKVKVIPLVQFASISDTVFSDILNSKNNIQSENSYYWLSLANAREATQGIARALGQVDVGNKERYINNAYEYSIQLDTLLGDSLRALKRFGSEKVVMEKGLLEPLAESLQLHIVGAFDISDEQNDSDKIATVLRSALRKNGAKTILADADFKNSSLGQTLADSSFKVIGIDPWGEISESYIGFMRDMISRVLRAL
jgi:ABC-type Zn uptake system ZnuABC Zn-binding protein ZnuA